MYVLANLHWFVLLLGPLVFFHELGHFLVAKLCRVKVLKFSLGFGPRLFGFVRGDTEYVVSALPLGGYVKMLGDSPMAEISPGDTPLAFSSKPVWQRSLIILAGPVFNLLLAFGVYLALFTGTQTFADTKLGVVNAYGPAWKAGLRPGDKILAIDGEPVPDWDALHDEISARPGESLSLRYERQGEVHDVTLKPDTKEEENVFQEAESRGRVGISVRYVVPVLGVVDGESPAAAAGLQNGDQLTQVNGTKVEAWHEVRAAVASAPAGQPLALEVKRGDETLQRSLLPQGPPPAGLPTELFSSADAPWGYTGLVTRDVVISEVEADTPAAGAGLEPGDRLVALRMIDDAGHSVERPVGVYEVDLDAFNGRDATNQFVLTYQRGRVLHTEPLRLAAREKQDELKNKRTEYVFGATNFPDLEQTYTFQRMVGPLEAAGHSLEQVLDDATLIAQGMAKMIQGRLSLDNMGSPIMVFVIAEKSAKRGAVAFSRVMAVISVNLAVLNVLPIPALDGGHLMFCLTEAIRRRPPSKHFRERAQVVGLALLLMLMVWVLTKDFFRYVLG